MQLDLKKTTRCTYLDNDIRYLNPCYMFRWPEAIVSEYTTYICIERNKIRYDKRIILLLY